MHDWKQAGQHFGIQLQRNSQALTDLRFADDILLFAKHSGAAIQETSLPDQFGLSTRAGTALYARAGDKRTLETHAASRALLLSQVGPRAARAFRVFL